MSTQHIFQTKGLVASNDERMKMITKINTSNVDLRVQFGQCNITLDDFLQLSEGDIIKLEAHANSEFSKPLFTDAEDEEVEEKTVTVQPVQFASFEDMDQIQGPPNQNLNILLDVKLQLTVELGKTELPIKKVLELTKGSIVTLNKAAGEPVELYANGKLIAYGEVVVIEDNFGLRITHITDPARRLNTISSNSNKDAE